MATPRVAAGALFADEQGRILMLRPTYKDYWDIPGGYVEPGESPLTACIREVKEELAIEPPIGRLLVVDWAPAPDEGDKLLFVFDGGTLTEADLTVIKMQADEVAEFTFVALHDLDDFTVSRLSRRLRTAGEAKQQATAIFAEHGLPTVGPGV
ncbi:MAG: NUDIX hydrolase [Micromonosporaceae bacterium]|nr:NUDIX hydrolase [Micromonosporaceae bacterium]